MFEIFLKVWYLIILLPFFIFEEATGMLAKFLKKRKIYDYWDIWHSIVVVLILLAILAYMKGI